MELHLRLAVDGTLVDSNDAHTRAWVEAFAKHDHDAAGAAVELQLVGGRSGIRTVIRVPFDASASIVPR